ncbi:hypothetical protein BDBG_17088 [Blastomyces gilchristii SLH14081]|uniref:Uncharacterized protein n=1 Tax=Blastomyces gilchristii (strain SLH14081) TaxID=559298 RepID=A0A179UN59_BLAGS|nr:uncharacterized protein BDBG_17088 [Blastomyces gilchristii SLH14081]OAT08659.1 hypothetical protein BDBG_17088 [Blastomyces gilchristii SLH14081]
MFWNIKGGQGFRGGCFSDISTITDRGSSKIKKIGAYGYVSSPYNLYGTLAQGCGVVGVEWGIIPHGSFEQRLVHIWLDISTTTRGMRSAMGSKCSYDRGLFDGSIGGFLFEKSSEFVVGRLAALQ